MVKLELSAERWISNGHYSALGARVYNSNEHPLIFNTKVGALISFNRYIYIQ